MVNETTGPASGDVTAAEEALTPAEVDQLVTDVQVSIATLRTALPKLYHGRAWVAAGLPDWETFCTTKFGGIKFPRLDRAAAVAELDAEGMSLRAIAAGLGVGKSTIARDLAPVPHGTERIIQIPDTVDGALARLSELGFEIEKTRRHARALQAYLAVYRNEDDVEAGVR